MVLTQGHLSGGEDQDECALHIGTFLQAE